MEDESPVIQAVRQRVRKWIDDEDCFKHPLNLSRMNITELPADIFTGCSQLKYIWLDNNLLTELPANIFTGCSQLEEIYLSSNQLTELPAGLFAGCSQLTQIDLSYNQLTELPVGLFAVCSQLKYIWLNGNQLTKLPVDIFSGCSQLVTIHLNNNQLTELPVGLFAECSKIWHIWFDKSLIYHVLWSLPDINKVYYEYSAPLKKIFPFECALVERYRRVANDPRSYAWSVRRYAVLGLS